jgi:uncharacterized membrane protein YGL010W
MKSLQNWFAEYAVSHQNSKNQLIHFICVPIIYFSIIGMLLSIGSEFLTQIVPLKNDLLVNWAVVFLIPVLLFYLSLSIKTFVQMLLFSIIVLLSNYYLSKYVNIFYFNLTLFIVAWIGQFYGHKIEGKKPSFFKDVQFLLIGPAWVFKKMLNGR